MSVGDAALEAMEYTQYLNDRRDGCDRLGMNLYPSEQGGLPEVVQGRQVYLTYFIRDYIDGMATDKIAPARYKSAGEPSPPAPTTKALDLSSFFCPSPPTS